MESLPKIADKARVPLDIDVHPYMTDHCFEGRAVLPAVEAMKLLATSVKTLKPDVDTACLTKAKFDKFLYLPPGSKHIAAFNDISVYENGDITTRLLTKTTSKKNRITRTKEHASICITKNVKEIPHLPFAAVTVPEDGAFIIHAEKIYSDLVLFGPAYQNILDNLLLSEDGASAKLRAPALLPQDGMSGLLGSPFPLDAAFHAACAWGQRFARFVAFPVAFEKRVIFKKTAPKKTYLTRVIPVRATSDLLVFDILIYDSSGVVFENVSGIQMRDVSAGRMKPPQWIMTDSRKRQK